MNLTRWTPLAALAVLAACEMPPEGTDETDVANFDTAVASIGCDLLDEGDYQAIELQTGLTRTQLQEMASFRVETGAAARLSNGGMRLVSGPCAPVETAEAPAAEAG
ncbi:hypothetical protein FIU97_05215 [Roseivivax sp. THAF40]|uniref:hypothetical protein n=1 Tax=unclassified Roseivivax TaxID=2639302 RepID=UPI00126783ED|nr:MULTISPECIES: hypothetical protein [unclassified Roseivivax]QFS82172.1 hypothetical protein FIV09_04955 [Roseivivax sp. THAF197b]QFT45972.1 hypothetical protein FIU97_05215 [Roseivivax sp. THAF40]